MRSQIPAIVRPTTRERLIESARELFWRKGYEATGLAEILDKADANSGSFYHFFESKEHLLRVVLDRYLERLEPELLRPAWRSTDDPLARVRALLKRYRQALVATTCEYGCPIGRLALEIPAAHTAVHDRIAANFSAWRKAVEACVRAAGIRNAEHVATFVLSVMEGSVMQARAYRTIEPFDVCMKQLDSYLKAMVKR